MHAKVPTLPLDETLLNFPSHSLNTCVFRWEDIAAENAGIIAAYPSLMERETAKIALLSERLGKLDKESTQYKENQALLDAASKRLKDIENKMVILGTLQQIITLLSRSYTLYQKNFIESFLSGQGEKNNNEMEEGIKKLNQLLEKNHLTVREFFKKYIQQILIDEKKIVPPWSEIPEEIKRELALINYQSLALQLSNDLKLFSLAYRHQSPRSKTTNASFFDNLKKQSPRKYPEPIKEVEPKQTTPIVPTA